MVKMDEETWETYLAASKCYDGHWSCKCSAL